MEISECRVKLCHNDPVRAIVSITFDAAFVVKGIRVLNVHDRFIVCMPSRPRKDGRHQDVAHPINSETRELINRVILGAYEEAWNRYENGESPGHHDEDEYPDGEAPGAWAP